MQHPLAMKLANSENKKLLGRRDIHGIYFRSD
jgi:hypothetical protein